jgi:hypothetical protein
MRSGRPLIVLSNRCNLASMPETLQPPQRRSARQPAQITVTLVLEGDEADQIATAIDLSQSGMRLHTDLSLEPGKRVGLLMSDNPNCVIAARVVWLGTTDSPQAGQAGLEFVKPLGAPV